MAKDKHGRSLRANGLPRNGNSLRKSVYFTDEVLASLHMGFEWEGGLSLRVSTIITNHDQLFHELKPDLTLRDWADVFGAMDIEGDYDDPASLLDHIKTYLHDPKWDLPADHIESLLAKLQAMTPPEWMMLNEAHFRYVTARKSMSLIQAVESVVGV